MRSIRIFAGVDDYLADLHQRALPDRTIVDHDFYRRLVGWVIDHRTPLLYEQDHPDEYRNLSINFNWLLLRDYNDSGIGPAETVLTMYVLHELVHMTHWLPTQFEELSPGEYADQFTRSEYRASNETEILLHYRVPSVRRRVFPGMRIAADHLLERRIAQPSMARLCNMRPLLVEDTLLDGFFEGEPELAANFKRFDGNREWARERFAAIAPHFRDRALPQGRGLVNDEYEAVIGSYHPGLSQQRYEANVIRNVRFGFGMCGLPIPELASIDEAIAAAADLEGKHAIVQS